MDGITGERCQASYATRGWCTHRRSQNLGLWVGGTLPTPPSLASVVHTFESVAGSRGSVSAPAVSRVMGGAPERNKNSKNIG